MSRRLQVGRWWRYRIAILLAGMLMGWNLSEVLAQPSNDYRAVYVDNGILRLGLGLAGQYQIGNVNYEAIGRLSLGTSGGTRFSNEDENLSLVGLHPFPCGNFGTVIVRVINADGTTDAIWGSGGSWVVSEPTPDRSGRYSITGRWLTGTVQVDQVVELVGGFARVTWTITNLGTAAQQVGIAFIIYPSVESRVPTGTPLYVLVPGYFPVQSDLLLRGGQVPAFIEVAPRRSVQTPILRWQLRQSGLTTPDRVAVGEFTRLTADVWGFVPLPNIPVNAYGIVTYWEPTAIQPGGSRVISTMVGLATSSNDPSGRFALDVESQPVLELDSSAPNTLAPQQFLVSATVTNYISANPIQNIPLDDVNLSISLPAGLELAEGESVTKRLGSIPPGQVATASWRVRPTGQRVGELAYRVSASASPGGLSKSVSRTITVPTLPRVSLKPSYQMLSFPFGFRAASPEQVLGLEAQQFTILRWSPEQRRYTLVDTLRPGEGYWIRSTEEREVTLNGAIVPVDPFSGLLRLPLPRGWVQIGNPFPYAVPIGLVRFVDTRTGFAVSFVDAVQQGLVRSVLFYYEPAPSPGYRALSLFSDLSAPLVPGRAYWIFVERSDLEILYPNVVTIGANVTFPTRLAFAPPQWQVQFTAQSNLGSDSATTIGVASRAADGKDIYDVPKPPAPVEPGVQVALVAPDGQETLAQDIRAEGLRRQVWEMVVSTPSTNVPVTLRWSGIREVPSTLRLKLVDPEARVTRDLRATASYTFTVGQTGTRRLQVIAEPRGAAGLRVTSLRVARTRGGGVSISYALSDAASAKVRILSATGKVVQNLQAGEAASRGVTNLTWNGRDSAGIAVPAGSYLVEVVATSEDGQTARAVQPIVITR
ncbi:MAG: hypothetical protein NZ741_08670 [Armatimonadetes bacterium]|nr:hypothetical protein [Armatimonadota bacterium]